MTNKCNGGILHIKKGGKILETIGERIRSIREEHNMSRRKFGEVLGTSENAIVNIEYDRLKRPDQKEPIYKLICQEFSLNMEWLMYGTGDKEKEVVRDNQISEFVGKALENESETFKKRFIAMLSSLDESDWETLEKIANLLQNKKEQE